MKFKQSFFFFYIPSLGYTERSCAAVLPLSQLAIPDCWMIQFSINRTVHIVSYTMVWVGGRIRSCSQLKTVPLFKLTI